MEKILRLAKIGFVFVFVLFYTFSLFALSYYRDDYGLKNISGEDLIFTVQYSGYDEIDLFPSYYYFMIEQEIINRPLPYQSPDPYQAYFPLFVCYPEESLKVAAAGHYEWVYNETRSAREMLGKVLEELTVYDTEGNIVLTLDDIEEKHFEYTDPNGKRLSPCIIITPEMVEYGRRKYAQDG